LWLSLAASILLSKPEDFWFQNGKRKQAERLAVREVLPLQTRGMKLHRKYVEGWTSMQQRIQISLLLAGRSSYAKISNLDWKTKEKFLANFEN
jgi:hypothetical protein